MPRVYLSVWHGEARRLTPYLPIALEPSDGRTVAQLSPSEIVLLAKRQLAFQQVLEHVDPFNIPVHYMGTAPPAPNNHGGTEIPQDEAVENMAIHGAAGSAAPPSVIYLRAVIIGGGFFASVRAFFCCARAAADRSTGMATGTGADGFDDSLLLNTAAAVAASPVNDYAAAIASFDASDTVFARHLRQMPAESVLYFLRDKRATTIEAWTQREISVPTLGLDTGVPTADCDVAVRPLHLLLAELYVAMEADTGKAATFAADLDRAWSKLRGPINAREGTVLIPHFMNVVLCGLLAVAGNPASSSPLLRGHYEHSNSVGGDDGSPDWSFSAEYEAKLARLSSNCVRFVLQLRREAEEGEEGDGKLNEGCSMAEGISQVLQRLAVILRHALGEGEKADTPCPRTAFGAASDGFNVVFVRVDVNTGDDRFQRPLIASRSHVLQLTAPTSAAGVDSAAAGSTGGSGGGGAACTPRSGGARAALQIHDEGFPSWAILNSNGASAAADPMTAIPPGLFGLLLALASADTLHGCLRPSPRRGILPPPLGFEGSGEEYWLESPDDTCKAGGFARVYFVSGRDGRQYAWKTMADEDDVELLAHERDVLAQLHASSSSPNINIISCVATATAAPTDGRSGLGPRRARVSALPASSGGDDNVSALVLHPVGRVASDLLPRDLQAAGGVWGFLADMASALRAAHAKGYCHCDLRPSNIVFGDGRFVLIDWGLSARTGTPRGGIVGVDAFLHDELLLLDAESTPGYEVDPRHDWASLAYSVIALWFGRGRGRCPWVHSRKLSNELKADREEWLANWYGEDKDGCDELRRWVRTLLGGTPTPEVLNELLALRN